MEALLGIAVLAATIACLRWLAPRPGRPPDRFLKYGMDSLLALAITASFGLGIGLTLDGIANLWQDSVALWAELR